MQWLVNYGPHFDIDGSTKWVKCGKCFSPYHVTCLQSPSKILTGPYVCTFFRLQAVIFLISDLSIYLFIFIFILFSFTLTMGKEQKKRKQLPKGPAKARMVGASHLNQDVNKWKEHVMKACLDEYYEELAAKNNIVEFVNRAAIAKKYSISPLTLHHLVSKLKPSHQVRGWRHASGGKRQPWKFTVGKCTSSFLSTALSHKIGLTGMTFKLSNQLHVFFS